MSTVSLASRVCVIGGGTQGLGKQGPFSRGVKFWGALGLLQGPPALGISLCWGSLPCSEHLEAGSFPYPWSMDSEVEETSPGRSSESLGPVLESGDLAYTLWDQETAC